MTTGELTGILHDSKSSPLEIKEILIHGNRPKKEWGLLCYLAVEKETNFGLRIDKILDARERLFMSGYPAYADGGGIDLWLALKMIEVLKGKYSAKEMAEILRDYQFDFTSACEALGQYFDLTAYPPNILMFTKGGERVLTDVIYWP